MKSTKAPILGPAGLELERLVIQPHGMSLFVGIVAVLSENRFSYHESPTTPTWIGETSEPRGSSKIRSAGLPPLPPRGISILGIAILKLKALRRKAEIPHARGLRGRLHCAHEEPARDPSSAPQSRSTLAWISGCCARHR